MSDNRIRDRVLATLKALSPEERKLFAEILSAENSRLSEKSPNMKESLLKIVRQVVR